jgi:micrococcal nuclease
MPVLPNPNSNPNPIATRWLALAVVAACCMAAPALSTAAAPHRDRWSGLVTYVVDGDTVRVRPLQGGKPVSIRVDGIDAPEICQSGGDAARDALKRRVLGLQVVIEGKSRDDYGRLLARIMLDGDDVGARMVKGGHAWSYRYRGSSGPYAAQQRLAESARRGIFADTNAAAVYPAAFRKQHGRCAR